MLRSPILTWTRLLTMRLVGSLNATDLMQSLRHSRPRRQCYAQQSARPPATEEMNGLPLALRVRPLRQASLGIRHHLHRQRDSRQQVKRSLMVAFVVWNTRSYSPAVSDSVSDSGERICAASLVSWPPSQSLIWCRRARFWAGSVNVDVVAKISSFALWC